ncbi:MAG: hypothetical protein PHU75_01595 [Candidatus Nanopelagicales bacterium]|nr:hypothetical protein [Candidatus Nanopelagicales bacterium]
MANTLLIAFSSATSEAQIPEFASWYEGTHIPEVRAAIPSISNVTRYQLTDPQTGAAINRFVAIYEIDEADIAAAAGQLFSNAAGFTQTDAMDRENDPAVLHWAGNTGYVA